MEQGGDSQSVIVKLLAVFSVAEGGLRLAQARCPSSQQLAATGVTGPAGYQMVSQD